MQPFALTHWDEGAIWSSAQWFSSFGHAGEYLPISSPPLAPVFFGWVARLLGSGVEAAIWVAVLFGTMSIVLIYLLARMLLSPIAGFAGAVMMAASGLNIMYSRSLLTEAFYVFFLLLTLLLSLYYLRRPTLRWAALCGLSATCLQYTKYNGALAAGPLLAVLAFHFITNHERIRKRQALLHGVVLAGIVTSAVLLNVAAIWIASDLTRFSRYYSEYVGKSGISLLELATHLYLAIPLFVLCLAVLGLIYAAVRLRSEQWTLIHIGFFLYVAFLFNYTFYVRLLAPVSVFLILYAAAAIHAVTEWPVRAYVPAIAVLGILFALSTWQTFPQFFKRDDLGYVRASHFLNTIPPSTPVLLATQRYVWTDLKRPVMFTQSSSSHQIEQETSGVDEVVLVTDIYVHYKYFQHDVEPFLESLGDNHLIKKIDNPLKYDVVENNLTLDELRRLDHDQKLYESAFSIKVYRLNGVEMRRLLDVIRTTRPAASARARGES